MVGLVARYGPASGSGRRRNGVDVESVADVLGKVDEYQWYVNKRDAAHYQMALRFNRHERLLGIPVIVTTTVVGTAIFATLQQDAAVGWKIATGLLSVTAATLAALQTFFNYGGEAQRHAEVAVGYARLWRHIDQFKLRYQQETATREECLTDLATLVKDMDDLERQAPRITNKIWQQVKNEAEHG